MKRRIIEVSKNVFVDSQPIDVSECERPLDDPASAFAQFLLPRIERGTDEASKEVRAAMKAGRSLSDAVIDAVEALPMTKTRQLRTWVEQARESHVYAFLRILKRPNSGVEYGLRLTAGGPRDKVIAEEQIDVYGPRISRDGFSLEGDELRRDLERILFGGYGKTARDEAMLKSACLKLRGRA